MGANVSRQPPTDTDEPGPWQPELGSNGRVEIFASYFDNNSGRFVSDSITVDHYANLWEAGRLKFQQKGTKRPEGHPSIEEVEAFLNGKLEPTSRNGSKYVRPVDPNKEVRRDPPAYLLSANLRQRAGMNELQRLLEQDDEQPEPFRLIQPVRPKLPGQTPPPTPPGKRLLHRAPTRPQAPQPQAPKDRVTEDELAEAFRRASDALWEKSSKSQQLSVAEIVGESLKYLPEDKVVRISSLSNSFYELFSERERNRLQHVPTPQAAQPGVAQPAPPAKGARGPTTGISVSAAEKVEAFKKASKALWAQGRKDRGLFASALAREATKHLPEGKTIAVSSMHTQLYTLFDEEERKKLLYPDE